MHLHARSSSAGISIVESSIAVAISVLFLGSVFTMNISTMDSIRGSKESVAASQVLQQRVESLRIANWQQITSAPWLKTNSLNTSAAGSEVLKNLTETLTLEPYGSGNVGNTKLVRSSAGTTTIVSQNAGLLTENAVKVIWTAVYNGAPNNRTVSRQIVAILAKGGVAK